MTVMLWSIPFERMTIDESNRLTVLCKLILKSVNRARERLELLNNERCSDGGRVLKAEAFGELLDTYREAEKKSMTDYVLLKVSPPDTDTQTCIPVISEMLHSAGYIGYGKDGGLYILLTGTGKEECESLMSSLGQKGIRTVVRRETEL